MKRRRGFLLAWFAVVLLLGLPIGCTFSDATRSIPPQFSQPALTTMKLESTAFTPNQLIPSTYTCEGKDISPPLSWSEPPEGTKSFALIVDDPDAPGRTFVHWVLYNLPPTTRQLPEGLSHQPELSLGGIQGKNDFDRYGYGGPCPPSGTHRYYFKLYALDTELDLALGVTKPQLLKEIEGHVLAEAELIGHYSRKR
ncbi:MAG: YbhB/YbcL family Raf kinase inhibitor-like protein [Cyanobacteria bacterium J055]|nr:MAG: YbhB/YbcL family Raf kinase inhibitor-like protein [Cyanobacteria bacterium J055]